MFTVTVEPTDDGACVVLTYEHDTTRGEVKLATHSFPLSEANMLAADLVLALNLDSLSSFNR